MTDVQFFKGFVFRKFEYSRYHTTDCITEHGSPRHFFAKLASGRAKLQAADITLELKAGDIFYIPFGARYRSHWYPEDGQVLLYSLGFNWLPSDISYRLQKIDDCSDLFEPLCEDLSVNARSIARLYDFFATVKDRMHTECITKTDKTAALATEYIRERINCPVSDIAKHCGVSESGLYGIFKKALGKTPVEVRHTVICDEAERLLTTTDLPIEIVSERLGFSSTSYFRKVLRAQTGQTPTAIRKRRM